MHGWKKSLCACVIVIPFVTCPVSAGPDVIASKIANDEANFGDDNDLIEYGVDGPSQIAAYSWATTACNLGDLEAEWIDGVSGKHPVIAQNMYRLKNGRFEQIGMGWLKHSFCAVNEPGCGTCQPTPCESLGIQCNDTYWGTLNDGAFGGPRSNINVGAAPGVVNHVHPFASPSGPAVIRGRVQVHVPDIDPAMNAGARYYIEGHYVTHDEPTREDRTNNASWRRVSVASVASVNTIPAEPTISEQAAIYAWQVFDSGVVITFVDIPNDGRIYLAHRATDNGDGTWHYEYALYNMTSDRSARSFSVPIPSGVAVTNIGFHDVDYHSGEPYALTDWSSSLAGGSLAWSTQTHAENANANALRWGTLYNFRFDADAAPDAAPASISTELFKPGAPASATFSAPGGAPAAPIAGPIPTVSQWGVVAMILLIAAAGTIVFTRERVAATV